MNSTAPLSFPSRHWLNQFLSHHCWLCRVPHRHAQTSSQSYMCTHCSNALTYNEQCCQRCARPLESGLAFTCVSCQKKPPMYRQCVTAFTFERDVKGLIHAFKYEHRLDYGKALSLMLAQHLHTHLTRNHSANDTQPTLLIPVPLHASKLKTRGFNQAHEVCKALSKHLNIPNDHRIIQRTRRTHNQHMLDAQERKRNVRNAFSLNTHAWRRLKQHTHIALIDDVVTTGATCQELSRVLQQHGDMSVDVWALARATKR